MVSHPAKDAQNCEGGSTHMKRFAGMIKLRTSRCGGCPGLSGWTHVILRKRERQESPSQKEMVAAQAEVRVVGSLLGRGCQERDEDCLYKMEEKKKQTLP